MLLMLNKEQPEELWETLCKSNDIHTDLAEIYPFDFFTGLASHFDKSPKPFELVQGVNSTVVAYLKGQIKKAEYRSELLQYTGAHLIKAGVAAKQLQYSLKQISRSRVAESVLYNKTAHLFSKNDQRGKQAYENVKFRNGPRDPFAYLREISNALSLAANEIIELPDKNETEATTAWRASQFVKKINAERKDGKKKLPAHYALEAAAIAFHPTWESHSSKIYSRGRYDHGRGGYASEATSAFHKIISKIDTRVPESLAGTAIENSRKQLKVD